MRGACAVRFKDGTEVSADLVVMAVGIRPTWRWRKPCACMSTVASS